ncbi:hypothetical protein CIL05_03690 [Virgibacillus profundi]|uniref:Galactose-1-phosphate uridylyltransferase n=1 Tax=Virgibacillus profundi TaxID=2024555 RepID=A0A2A2IHV9_9BACI|nr:hypothetical protein [Virgibacillus profundi]PAV30834.1 hypothetical protein CIL05_03690 [Virgibacillus profundi]PXY55017.1 hypothetical protein CIT14_03770 [Virgibacillus profundi]
MESLFQKHVETFTFYDGEGNKIERNTEVRFDPLTGESSRLVFDTAMTLTAPDYTEAAEKSGGANCPFCPENVHKLTPVFPNEIASEGRISQGESIVFPNLFPYSKHNGVVVFSKDHYVRLQEFTTTMIKDAFIAAQTYIERVVATEEKDDVYASINWNYLPYSGGSILHPHLHVVVSESATNYQSHFERKARAFKENHGQDYLTYLLEMEKENEERWIGEKGNVAWVHAFAPKSHNDFLAVFPKAVSIDDIGEQDWTDFAEGLQAIFSTLTEQGFASFNMVFTVSNEGSPVHARLIPRLTLGGLDTSDINFFQALHLEPLSYKSPEDIAEKARVHFLKK